MPFDPSKGKQFSKDYQPPNRGRKPLMLKKFLKDNNLVSADIEIICKTLLAKSANELLELAKDKDKPILITGAAAALLKDIQKGSIGVYSFLLDRGFGKLKDKQEIDFSDDLFININFTKIDDGNKEEN